MPYKNKFDTFFKEQYSKLNAEQKSAVDGIDDSLLVLAGPGTGKTQLLSVRCANILRQGKAAPENILMLTFSNAAAKAMRERLTGMIGHDGYRVEVETFHSFANSVVLESEEALNYVKDKIEITEIEKIRAIEYILDNVKGAEPLRPFGAPYIHRSEIEKRISELKNEGILPGEFKEGLKAIKPDGVNLEEKHISRLEALAVIYANYEDLKDGKRRVLFDDRGRIDFDDMIIVALEALKREKTLREYFQKQYRYIMVDEFQDTNRAQLELLFSLLDPDTPAICCVGDDDQSIYRFQGATLSNFRTLEKKIPGLKIIQLKDNYRSTEDIMDLSLTIIAQLPSSERVAVKIARSSRYFGEKGIRFVEFSTEEEELAFIAQSVKEQIEIIAKDANLTREERERPYNNIAVFLRKRNQILKVIDAFLRAGIPYATDGEEDIRAEKRVRQMLDVVELASVDIDDNEKKSLVLYKVLSADYMKTCHSDILSFIGFVNKMKGAERGKDVERYASFNLFQEFQRWFPADSVKEPSRRDTEGLEVVKSIKLKDARSLHRAAWIITRLLMDARNRPVHDLLLQYIEDAGLYRFILKAYEDNDVLRLRDLRSLVSFINRIKESDLADPALGLDAFMEELSLREMHNMPLSGKLATMSQDGVRLYTAHASKGLEFYTVFVPFCLQGSGWPLRKKGETVPLPPEIFKSKERAEDKEELKQLNLYDELRLFYVASTRAKAFLIYTASPREKAITSQFIKPLGIDAETFNLKSEESFLVDFLEKAKRRDPFESAADILKDMVQYLSLNPTSLNNYLTCRRKFLYDNVLKLPGRKNQHLVFGNCAHKALEEIYRIYMDKKKFPDFKVFKGFFIKELEFQGASKEIRIWCSDRLETLVAWYNNEERNPRMPLDLENKIDVAFPEGLVFRGTFDKVEEERDGSVRVVDYKTGKPDDHVKAIANCTNLADYECDDYYRQLVAYKMLYEEGGRVAKKAKVLNGVLVFLEPASDDVKKYDLEKGVYKNITIELTDEMVGELKSIIMDTWRNIRALKFEKLPERDGKVRCARCAYDGICWES